MGHKSTEPCLQSPSGRAAVILILTIHPTKGRRLSLPGRLVTYQNSIVARGTISVLTESNVVHVCYTVTTTELSPPPQWLATTEQHHHRGVLQCSLQSFWTLFPENCPSLPQRHLIPAWTVNARRDQGISRRHPTPPALPRTSVSPLAAGKV